MSHPLFDQFLADADEAARAVVDRLADRAVTVHASRNGLLYEQGDANDGIHLVAHGAVVLEWQRPNGSPLGFRLALAGDNFGARSFCAGQPHAATARAVRETMVLRIPATVLTSVLRELPALWRTLARVVARDAGPQLAKVLRDPRTPARLRLAYLLAYLDERLAGWVTPVVGHPDSPLRQRDVAHLLDVTDETVSRSVTALARDGLVRAGADGLRVPDAAALRAAFDTDR